MYQGEPLIKGKRVTGFTNGEEATVNLTHVVPFLVEDELKRVGGLYEKAADWAPFAVVDRSNPDRPESGFVDWCGQGTDRIARSSKSCLAANDPRLAAEWLLISEPDGGGC